MANQNDLPSRAELKTTFQVTVSLEQARDIADTIDRGRYGLDHGEVVRNLIRIAVKQLVAESDLPPRSEPIRVVALEAAAAKAPPKAAGRAPTREAQAEG